MNEGEKRGIEKSKVTLTIAITLVVILAISNVWLYTRADYWQNRASVWEAFAHLLEMPRLHKVETYWKDNRPFGTSPYVNYYGNVFNSGHKTAYNVVLTVRIYDSPDTLLKSEEIQLGNIESESYQTFDVDIDYSGDADHITSALTHD